MNSNSKVCHTVRMATGGPLTQTLRGRKTEPDHRRASSSSRAEGKGTRASRIHIMDAKVERHCFEIEGDVFWDKDVGFS